MKILILFLFLSFTVSVTSQVGVGTNTPESDVHVSSTNTDGGSIQIDGGIRLGGDDTTQGAKGSKGQVLTSNGDAEGASWETPGAAGDYKSSCFTVSDIAVINTAVPSGSNRNTVNVTAAQTLTALNILPNGGILLIRTLTATTYTAANTYLTVELPSAALIQKKKFVIAFDGPVGSNNILSNGDNFEIVVKTSEANSVYYGFDIGAAIPKVQIDNFLGSGIYDISKLENNTLQNQKMLIFNSISIESLGPLTWNFTEPECAVQNPVN